MKKQPKKIALWMMALLMAASGVVGAEMAVADRFCVTERCKKAEKEAVEAQASSESATRNANSLAGAIAALKQEILALQTAIAASQARAEDLAGQIKITQAKLKAGQEALAKLLIDWHFTEDEDALMILAGSNSLSDFSEKQARAEATQLEITEATKKIKEVKLDLEKRKQEVDRILMDQAWRKRQIENKEAEQTRLMEKYRHDASSFAADAEKARKVKAEEIAKEIARLNSSGAVGYGINSYQWRNICPDANLSFGNQWGYVCQCVSYTGFKAHERWGVHIAGWGNANTWHTAARARGFRVDRTPALHTVAVNPLGVYGHVMWVESVNFNGTINISEYNNAYSSKSGRWGDYGFRTNVSTAGLWFIHFN